MDHHESSIPVTTPAPAPAVAQKARLVGHRHGHLAGTAAMAAKNYGEGFFAGFKQAVEESRSA